MTKELYLNEQAVDLSDAAIALNIQVNDITKPESIQSNFSNQFKVPRTKRNEVILESVADPQSLSNLPYTKLPAKFVQNGYELVPSGYAVIDNAEDKSYKVTLYSGFADFFNLIDKKKLSDLNFGYSIGSFPYGVALMAALFDESVLLNVDLPIFAPVNDYGSLPAGTTSSIDINSQYPAVWVRSVLKKIITEAGLTPIGDFFNSKLMQELYMPFSNGRPVHTDAWLELQKFKAVKVGSQFIPGAGTLTDQKITFTDNTVLGFDNGANWSTAQSKFIHGAQGTRKVRFKIKVTLLWDDANVKNEARVSVLSTGSPLGGLFRQNVVAPLGIGVTSTHEIDTGLIEITEDVWIGLNNFFAGTGNATVLDGSVECVETDKYILIGQPWEIEPNLPDMAQKDFVKDILYLTHSLPKFDTFNKTVEFIPFEQIYVNKGNAKDWTDKLVEPKKTNKSFKIPNLARKNFLKWKKNETDGLKEDYGNAPLVIADENLEPEKTFYEMHFSPSPDVVRMAGLRCCQIKSNGNSKTTPRLMLARWRTYLETFTITDGVNNYTIPLRIAESFFNDLKFENIIPVYYKNFQASMLDKPKYIKDYFKLNECDVYDFDHLIPVYLHQYNDYFYVNKINNFKANALSVVEIIRL